MLFASNRPLLYYIKLFLAAAGILLCIGSANNGHAAPAAGASVKTFSNPPPAERAVGLKLDLGPAMADDDCEEDYADLMDAAATTGERPKSAAQRPATASPAASQAAAQAAGQATAQAGAMAATGAQAATAAPAAAAATAAAPAAPPLPSWEVTPADKTLNTVLARWAATAGWQLVWELPVDYAVSVRTELHGTFADAVGLVTKSMASAEVPIKAIFYEGNHVLRIVAKGSE
jgi:hypothetical protein